MTISTNEPTNEAQTLSSVSRRRFLARAGIPAAAAVAVTAFPAVAHAEPAAAPSDAPQITVAELRSMTTAPANLFYFVTDSGMEGLFRYEPTDTKSTDNTGTVVVSAGQGRFKRVFSGPLNVRWFGAKGDGQADDAPAIQRAIDTAQTTGASVYIPAAVNFYALKKPIVITSARLPIRVFGDGPVYTRADKGSVLRAHPSITADNPLEAIILFTDTRFVTHNSFEDFTIYGGHVTKYGIYSNKLTNTKFSRLEFRHTLVAGLAIGYGWCNDVLDCHFAHNKGDGIATVSYAVNNLNIVNCRIVYNTGIGLNITDSAQGVRVTGCQFEQIRSAAIVAQAHIRTLQVTGNYFEYCAVDGYRFTDPDRLIRAYVVVNGTKNIGTINTAEPSGAVNISDNFVALAHVTAPVYFVAAYSGYGGVQIVNNSIVDANRKHAFVVTGTSKTGAGARVENLVMHGNGVPWNLQPGTQISNLDITDLAGATTDLHTATIEGVYRTNYAPSLSRFNRISTGKGGYFRDKDQEYRTHDVHEILGTADTDTWGFTISLADHPELAGKYVYFACFVKASDTTTGPVLYTSQLGARTATYATTADWHVVSYVDKLPATGTVKFGIGKTSSSSTSKLLVARPVLAEVGVRFDAL